MLLSKRFLRVMPNPFAAPLDHEGRPCAAVQYDPQHSHFVRHIGAQRVETITEKRKGRPDKIVVTWTFDVSPVDIEDTQFHRDRIASGELLAADAETSKRVGLKIHADPLERLRVACAERLTEWVRDHETGLPESLSRWFGGESPLIANWPAPPGSALAKEREERAAKAAKAAPIARPVEPAKPELSAEALGALGLATPPEQAPASAGGDVS